MIPLYKQNKNKQDKLNIVTGVEFETGRIIDNKKEYGKRIDLGNLSISSSGRTVETGLSNVYFTRPIEGMATNGTYCFPINGIRPMDGTDNSCIGAYIVNNQIILMSKTPRSDYTGYVEIYYIKK